MADRAETAVLGDQRFSVQVDGLPDWHEAGHQVVLHGINKSGSGTLTHVLADAYYAEDRANQFFSTYLALPRKHERMREIIAHSTGHAFFGGHYLYDSYPAGPERVLITQFRNPLPRVRSAYQWQVSRHGIDEPFEQWVRDTRGIQHSQVFQFGIGFSPDAPDWRSLSGEEVLARAIDRVERDVSWFGIAEYFEESVFMAAALCGLPSVGAWTRDDRNAGRPLVDTWPQHEIDLVQDVFRWDFELYAWAVRRFKDRLSGLTMGPELARYQAACRDEYNDRLDVDGRPIT